jgi:hypothetical protein
MMILRLLFIISCASVLFAANVTYVPKASNGQTIRAWVIPHSHCDPGWLVPMDTYYNEAVHKILTNTLYKISKNPTQRFLWAETVFFRTWWSQQNDTTKALVKNLISNKQLEFVCGGWVMNDEALVDYPAVIDQMTEGHQYLLREVGVKPRVAWQIDPFGAARTSATLFSLMGFEYYILNRIDDRLKYKFDDIPGSGVYRDEKHFEFYWQASKNYKDQVKLFTHVLDHHYSPPERCDKVGDRYVCTGFDFEAGGEGNPPITPENVHARAQILTDIIKEYSEWYRTPNILIPFGNDFRFVNPDIMFDNMDRLIHEINTNSSYGIEIRYGTMSEYFDAVMEDGKKDSVQFPVKTWDSGDYFPYTNCWGSEQKAYNNCITYWTGYFTSYPNFKQTVRDAEEFLRTSELIYALFKPYSDKYNSIDWDDSYAKLDKMRHEVGVVQHHDAITGTETHITLVDYYARLANATRDLKQVVLDILSTAMTERSSTSMIELNYDPAITQELSPTKMIPVVLYNNLAWTRKEYVSLRVYRPDVQVTSLNEDETTQLHVTYEVLARNDNSYDLHFIAELPPLGFATYYVQVGTQVTQPITKREQLAETISLENDVLKVDFSLTQGNLPYVLQSVTNKRTGYQLPVTQYYTQYQSYGDGAYLFRPADWPTPLSPQSEYTSFTLVHGKNVQELHQQLTNNLTQTFRLYNSYGDSGLGEFLEFTTTVKLADDKEMSAVFSAPSMKTNGVFYTDNSGFEMLKRVREIRWNDTSVQSIISGNYYPMVSSSYIRDTVSQLTLLSRQAMGVSSQQDGSIEAMINRNTLTDDWRGVGEHVNESDWVTVQLRVVFSDPSSSENMRPLISKRFDYQPLQLFVNLTSKGANSISTFADNYKTMFTPMTGLGLPQNVHLLNLQVLEPNQTTGELLTVVRLQHLYEIDQSQIFSRQEKMILNSLFDEYNLASVTEKSLSLNFDKQTMNPQNGFHLNPLEIRTFTLQLNPITHSYWQLESFLIGFVACVGAIALLAVIIFLVRQFILAQKRVGDEETGESTRLINSTNTTVEQ